MASTIRLPPKKDVALELLKQSSVYVFLDPRGQKVQVPAWFKKQAELVLQVGLNMAVPIPDLNVDDDGLSCTLSFNRTPHLCRIPWSAVYALRDELGHVMVWPDDVPAEIAAQAPAPAKPTPERPAHLRVATALAEPAPAAEPAQASKPKKAAKKARKLAAAPAAAATPVAAAKKPRARKQAAKQAPQADAAPPSKSKRDLPPYLRVVK
ncbi:MAG TPA: ClpXP protease specificity-enhancing factor SspB [Polyangiaceae bacterium]|jgi:stringent starvation protein B